MALEIKRRLRSLLSRTGTSRELLIVAHPQLVEYLRHEQHAWQRELACSLALEADKSLHVEAFSLLDNGQA